MRMSCNGCRVLRKGCSETCSIRPCLTWISSPSSQSNAVVFLAKFYGRAGLLNLLNAAPHHLQPAVFRSLLYEAAGRIVNPLYGSVGLLWSRAWERCQDAVDAVLRGDPIVPGSTSTESAACDIRHVVKQEPTELEAAAVGRKVRTRTRSSRGAGGKRRRVEVGFRRAGSHESSVTHPSGFSESGFSASRVNSEVEAAEESDVELELTLTLGGSSLAASSSKN